MQPPRSMTVHPHTRGEHALALVSAPHLGGSSPHPWGTRRFLRDQGGCRRFIPTPVGNTAASLGWSMSADGSSPHPWGTLLLKTRRYESIRFIPTPVGNTLPLAAGSGAVPVHPHTRGEHFCQKESPQTGGDSSPHPWGTLRQKSGITYTRRFIPTPMGNTGPGPGRRRSLPVHPHTRGEHAPKPQKPKPTAGSSPHPWGTQRIWFRTFESTRFIPTPVGNTSRSFLAIRSGSVHPHTRGEHCSTRESTGAGFWFIPTPVGNTRSRLPSAGPQPVHPHTRGEHPYRIPLF